MKITVVDSKDNQNKKNNKKLSAGVAQVRLSDSITRSYCEQVDGGLVLHIKSVKASEMTRRKWILLVREIVRTAQAQKFEVIELNWQSLTAYEGLGDNLAEVAVQAAQMAQYEFRVYKSKPEEGWNDLKEIVLVVPTEQLASVRTGVRHGTIVADAVRTCRDLANTPGEDMTPKILVRKTRTLLRKLDVRMRVLGERDMIKKKMNGVLTVGRGSKQESQFIILEYFGAKSKTTAPTVLVGKGVTFDSGGIDVKPHPHGLEMMMDMSGGAAVIAAMVAISRLGLKRNIVAIIPAVENMADGNSMRPGDIIRMMDGTTVEVGHTDAEGRIILADALTYAKRYKPATVIDVATLTGASMAALGERASAIFTTDDELAKTTSDLGEAVGDYVWRLPLWDEYDADIKGTHGDISNISKSKYGGAITAAAFLKHFARDHKRWMHIDIAPTMTATSDEHLAKGAKGSPVRLLVELLQKL